MRTHMPRAKQGFKQKAARPFLPCTTRTVITGYFFLIFLDISMLSFCLHVSSEERLSIISGRLYGCTSALQGLGWELTSAASLDSESEFPCKVKSD